MHMVCVYVSVCRMYWAHVWVVQKRLNRSKWRLGLTCGSKEPCVRLCPESPMERGSFEWYVCPPIVMYLYMSALGTVPLLPRAIVPAQHMMDECIHRREGVTRWQCGNLPNYFEHWFACCHWSANESNILSLRIPFLDKERMKSVIFWYLDGILEHTEIWYQPSEESQGNRLI